MNNPIIFGQHNIETVRQIEQNESAWRTIGIEGVVYFLLAENGLCKIGWTKHIAERLSTLQRMAPCVLNLTHIIASNHPNAVEYLFHAKYETKRKHGEWFALTENDLQFVKAKNQITLTNRDDNNIRYKSSQQRRESILNAIYAVE